MGFLDKLLTTDAIKKVGQTVLSSVSDHLTDTRSVDALTKKSEAQYILFVKGKTFSVKRNFNVYNEFEEQKYTIKTDFFTFGDPSLTLFDAKGNEIGSVELLDRSSRGKMESVAMYLGQKRFCTIHRKRNTKSFELAITYELSSNGWKLKKDPLRSTFTVTNKEDDCVMKFTDAFSAADTYVLEINNRENEIIGLLLVMAMDIDKRL